MTEALDQFVIWHKNMLTHIQKNLHVTWHQTPCITGVYGMLKSLQSQNKKCRST